VEGRIENPYEPSPFSRFNQVGIVHLLGEGLGFETIWVLTFFQTAAFLAADCWRMVGNPYLIAFTSELLVNRAE
jgi:hypothetical protein